AKLTDGWLHTGDVFYKDKDGFFYFRSRVDDMFSCGGENVYPKEVENLLFGHPEVVNAVVAPVPHPVKGLVPAAMVGARAGSTISRPIALPRGRPIRIRVLSTSSLPFRSMEPARSIGAQSRQSSRLLMTQEAVRETRSEFALDWLSARWEKTCYPRPTARKPPT